MIKYILILKELIFLYSLDVQLKIIISVLKLVMLVWTYNFRTYHFFYSDYNQFLLNFLLS